MVIPSSVPQGVEVPGEGGPGLDESRMLHGCRAEADRLVEAAAQGKVQRAAREAEAELAK